MRRSAILFVLASFAGFALRVYIASRGHNYDMLSWIATAGVALTGQNVYAVVGPYGRYNYGPVWMLILQGLGWIHDTFGMAAFGDETFHVMVAGFLSLVDVAVAVCLLKRVNMAAALFFFLNPVLILITGFHSQIDILAILPALLAWMLMDPRHHAAHLSWQRIAASAALLGVSLATKHLMVFFPIWLVMCPKTIGSSPRRLMYAAIAYAVFVGSFVPFAIAPGAIDGIWQSVVNYRGRLSAHTLFPTIIDLFMPLYYLGQGLPREFPVLQIAFAVAMMAVGWWMVRNRPGTLFEQYLLALVVFASAMADQYLVIPMFACAVAYRRWPSWFYTAAATWVLLTTPNNIGDQLFGSASPLMTQPGYQHYSMAQVWLIFLLFGRWQHSRLATAAPEGRSDKMKPTIGPALDSQSTP